MSKSAEVKQWRRALACTGGTCVEVAKVNDRYLVRDSKAPEGAVLEFTAEEWASFVAGVKEGDFSF
ncbi:DUF397 domain-containing protein [Actinoplanes bogorensis]|uniref:DUF397 domain-containing protein n=1 Tax=Paractinoplanes bogorensis TaxID=1610840 RepID=A0ABS5YW22_9ACTN|nr:DUF397 domain-containing protein [Actinoplanes bogorensis]MBU2667646.1 DUF397 domain-containing protein [Actinoplanes bogorensis]